MIDDSVRQSDRKKISGKLGHFPLLVKKDTFLKKRCT